MTKRPLISIGIPAYNSAAHIGFTIEGMLSQTFEDFEVIVSDNASTDGTCEVVERYMRGDPRIRYERHPVNIGANPNYSHLVRCARGEYFKWSSSSDWCAPTFLECCLSDLSAHQDAVLVVPRTFLFQEKPELAEAYSNDFAILDESPAARFKCLYTSHSLNNAMNGLIRMSALRRTRLIDSYVGADIVLMGHLALMGKFRLLEQRLFYRRMDRATATALQDDVGKWRHHYPQRSVGVLFQGSKRQLGLLWGVMAAPMSFKDRLSALTIALRMIYWNRSFIWDDLRGVWQYFRRGAWPG